MFPVDAHHHFTFGSRAGSVFHIQLAQVFGGPRRQQQTHVFGILRTRQQMVRAGERHETLGMQGSGENQSRVADVHRGIGGRVEDQQRFAQCADILLPLLGCQVVQEGLLEMELASRQQHVGLALLLDDLARGTQQAGYMFWIGGCRYGRYRDAARNPMRGFQHRGAAQRMSHQDPGCLVTLLEKCRRLDQIGNVGAERGVGKYSLALAEAGEIEAQHRDALHAECTADVHGGAHILAAGEAGGIQRVGVGFAVGGHLETAH